MVISPGICVPCILPNLLNKRPVSPLKFSIDAKGIPDHNADGHQNTALRVRFDELFEFVFVYIRYKLSMVSPFRVITLLSLANTCA